MRIKNRRFKNWNRVPEEKEKSADKEKDPVADKPEKPEKTPKSKDKDRDREREKEEKREAKAEREREKLLKEAETPQQVHAKKLFRMGKDVYLRFLAPGAPHAIPPFSEITALLSAFQTTFVDGKFDDFFTKDVAQRKDLFHKLQKFVSDTLSKEIIRSFTATPTFANQAFPLADGGPSLNV